MSTDNVTNSWRNDSNNDDSKSSNPLSSIFATTAATHLLLNNNRTGGSSSSSKSTIISPTTPTATTRTEQNEGTVLPTSNNLISSAQETDIDERIQSSRSLSLSLSYPRKNSGRFVLIFIGPGLGGLLFGYDISATSFAIVEQTAMMHLGPILQGCIVAAASFGALLGSYIIYAKKLDTRVGRREELQRSALFYIVGTTLVVYSGLGWHNNYNNNNKNATNDIDSSNDDDNGRHDMAILITIMLLLVGRIFYGIGIAYAMHGGPTYLAEMTPPNVRGIVVSLKEACIVLGIVLGYSIGNYFYNTATISTIQSSSSSVSKSPGWIHTYGSTIVFSIPMLLITRFGIPESYRWLLLQQQQQQGDTNSNNDTEALQSIRFVYPYYSEQDAQEELNRIKAQLTNEESSDEQQQDANAALREPDTEVPYNGISDTNYDDNSTNTGIWSPRYRGQLLAGYGLIILQQITGQPSVLSYATSIFQQAGLSSSATVSLGIVKLITTLIAASTVETLGRTKLLYIGNTAMALALLTLTLSVSYSNNNDSSTRLDSFVDMPNSTSITDARNDTLVVSSISEHTKNMILVTAMFVYIGGYQFSFGPIVWLLISEIFPLRIRGQAIAVAVQLNFLFNTIVQFIIPTLQIAIGYNTTFGIFTILTIYSLYFVSKYVPETKGLTLEEIEGQFHQRRVVPPSYGSRSGTDETDEQRRPLLEPSS